MGYIKEPDGIDLNLSPMPLSTEDRQKVSAIIAQYKDSGKKPKSTQGSKVTNKRKPSLRSSAKSKLAKEAPSKKESLTASGSDK